MDTPSKSAPEPNPEPYRLPVSVLREFPDRAIRWLLESPDNVKGLLRMAAPDVADRFEVSKLRQAPRSFVQESLRAREADCVLRMPFRSGDGASEHEVWVYILLEHQSDPDPWMAFRLLSYMLALWESERREQEDRGVNQAGRRLSVILPIVLYTGQRPWERLGTIAELMNVPTELASFVPRHDSVFFSASTADPRALTAGGDPLGYMLLLFHLADAPVGQLAQALREVFAGLERLARSGELDRWYRLAWIVVGYIRHRRPPHEVGRLVAAAKDAIEDATRGREVEVMARTSAEELIEKGREIGLIAGKREALLRLMRQKFGALPSELETQVTTMNDASRIDDLLLRVLTATSLEEMGL